MSEPINGDRLWKQLQALCERHGLGKPIHVPDFEERISKALTPSATSRREPAQSVPEGMWYFTFYCENYDAVQRIRVAANAPRQFTCGVTGIAKAGKP